MPQSGKLLEDLKLVIFTIRPNSKCSPLNGTRPKEQEQNCTTSTAKSNKMVKCSFVKLSLYGSMWRYEWVVEGCWCRLCLH